MVEGIRKPFMHDTERLSNANKNELAHQVEATEFLKNTLTKFQGTLDRTTWALMFSKEPGSRFSSERGSFYSIGFIHVAQELVKTQESPILGEGMERYDSVLTYLAGNIVKRVVTKEHRHSRLKAEASIGIESRKEDVTWQVTDPALRKQLNPSILGYSDRVAEAYNEGIHGIIRKTESTETQEEELSMQIAQLDGKLREYAQKQELSDLHLALEQLTTLATVDALVRAQVLYKDISKNSLNKVRNFITGS